MSHADHEQATLWTGMYFWLSLLLVAYFSGAEKQRQETHLHSQAMNRNDKTPS